MIAQLTRADVSKGNNILVWDGSAASGTKILPGQYTFEVMAQNERAGTFKGQTKISGIVTDVHFENGETVLKIDHNRQILLTEVTGLRVPDEKGRNLALLKSNAASSYNQ